MSRIEHYRKEIVFELTDIEFCGWLWGPVMGQKLGLGLLEEYWENRPYIRTGTIKNFKMELVGQDHSVPQAIMEIVIAYRPQGIEINDIFDANVFNNNMTQDQLREGYRMERLNVRPVPAPPKYIYGMALTKYVSNHPEDPPASYTPSMCHYSLKIDKPFNLYSGDDLVLVAHNVSCIGHITYSPIEGQQDRLFAVNGNLWHKLYGFVEFDFES